MELIFLFTGLLIGFALAWFIKKPRSSTDSAELKKLQEQLQKALNEKISLESAQNFISREKQNLEEEKKNYYQEHLRLNTELTRAISENKNIQQRLSEQKQETEELHNRFKLEFENLANRILEEKSKKFTDQNKVNLDQILKPFNERIKDFEKKVGEAYDIEMRDKISLREEVRRLYDLNAKISEEANNLTRALKGDTKKQGNWGELILEKVMERSGLVKDREYRTQVVTKNADGEVIKPDMVVFLPDDKHLIVDSKVSLTAYEQFVNAEEEEDREKALKEHILSIRSHIRILSDKKYQSSDELSTPDFVLLFMPIESAFGLAMQQDHDLFHLAWEKHIVIVSPTTLLATLRTIASLWKIEKQNKYAMEIAEQAGRLYDKFEGLLKDLLDIGKKMDDSKKSYEEAMKKISTGPGNLVKKVEDLKTLGAKANKSLPLNILDRAREE